MSTGVCPWQGAGCWIMVYTQNNHSLQGWVYKGPAFPENMTFELLDAEWAVHVQTGGHRPKSVM